MLAKLFYLVLGFLVFEILSCVINGTEYKLELVGDCFSNGSLPKYKQLEDFKFSVVIKSRIEIIRNDSLRSLDKAEDIVLSNNGLIFIQEHSLSHMSNLRFFAIKYNDIEVIQKNVFCKTNLLVLSVTNNKIQLVQKLAFSDMPSLKLLHLSSNQLQTWNPKWFGNLTSLLVLYVSNNSITSLPAHSFKHLPGLLEINFSSNKISIVDSKAFSGLSSLKFLDLSSNSIKSFGATTFRGIAHLWKNKIAEIHLAKNLLAYLPQGLLDSIKNYGYLTVHHNPWRCPCLFKIYKWAYAWNITIEKAPKSYPQVPICVTSLNNTECVESDDEEASNYYLRQLEEIKNPA